MLARLLLVFIGLAFGLLAAEVALRIIYPDGGLPSAHLQAFSPEALASFHEDSECGYLPVPGTGEYGLQGCLKNSYDLEHRTGKRVLFAGDSATRRGKIVEALRNVYGDSSYEYWNAGVESFNTLQELVLYRRYNFIIKPDEVVLTFHNNDFQATPLVVREKGELKIFAPGTVNQFLFRNSYFYRWAWPRTELGDRTRRAAQVLDSLREFKTMLAQENVPFKIVLLPILKPIDKWDEPEQWSRQQSMADFKELDLSFIDLLPCLETAIKDGVEVQESPGDTWHPSEAVSQRFAVELKRQGLLGP